MWSKYVEETSKQVSLNFIPYLLQQQYPKPHVRCLGVDKYKISYVNVFPVKRFPVGICMAFRYRAHNNDDSNASDDDTF